MSGAGGNNGGEAGAEGVKGVNMNPVSICYPTTMEKYLLLVRLISFSDNSSLFPHYFNINIYILSPGKSLLYLY